MLQVFRLARISAGGVVTVASLSSLFPLRAGRIEGSWHLQLLEAQTRLQAYRQNKRPLTGRHPPALILSSGRPAGLRYPFHSQVVEGHAQFPEHSIVGPHEPV